MDGQKWSCNETQFEMIEKLTDERFILLALKRMAIYRAFHPEDQFNVDESVKYVLDNVPKVFRASRGLSEYSVLNREQTDECNALSERIHDTLKGQAYKKAKTIAKQMRIHSVNATTADVIIRTAAQEVGLVVSEIDTRSNRIKVTVSYAPANHITFYVRYSEVMSGKVDKIIGPIKELTEQLVHLDRDVKVWCDTGILRSQK